MENPSSSIGLLFSHPVTLYFLQTNLMAVVLGFTAPSSAIRPLAFPVLLILTWLHVSTCSARIQNVSWATFMAGGNASNVFQYIETSLLSRWNFESQGPQRPTTKSAPAKNGQRRLVSRPWQRLRFGYYATFSYRCCGTPYEVKNVPPFSFTDRSYVPSRRVFLSRILTNYILAYLIMDALTSFRGTDTEASRSLYTADKIPFFFRLKFVTLEEIAVRIVSTVMFWGASYIAISLFVAPPAILGVALGLTDVSWWHPFMGPISGAYSIRQFWGSFWHQSTRQRFSNLATYIVQEKFRFRRGSLLARYTKLALAFIASGIMHAIIDTSCGIPFSRSGSLRFFPMQAAGIALEDAVQASWRKLFTPSKAGTASQTFIWRCQRVIGYVWFLLWLSWSSPIHYYHILEANKGESKDIIVPVSIVQRLIPLVKGAF